MGAWVVSPRPSGWVGLCVMAVCGVWGGVWGKAEQGGRACESAAWQEEHTIGQSSYAFLPPSPVVVHSQVIMKATMPGTMGRVLGGFNGALDSADRMPVCHLADQPQGFAHDLFPLYMEDDDALLRASHANWVLSPITRAPPPPPGWRAGRGGGPGWEAGRQPDGSGLTLPTPLLQWSQAMSCTWDLRGRTRPNS